MKYFYIIANYNKEYAREAEREITEYLQKRGAVCTVQGLVPEDTQCVITIGGDGTLIQAARDLAGRGLPLLGVNRGHLGYLNQVSRQEDITWAMDSLLEDRYLSVENSLVDMGDEVFTKGRPHPVMDPSILVDRLIQEAHDPETGVILFDLLYGYAIHPDPVGAIEDALREVARIERDEGRHICLVASLCGTDIDPQNVAEQARRLREYGVVIQPSNARAALLAGLIVS